MAFNPLYVMNHNYSERRSEQEKTTGCVDGSAHDDGHIGNRGKRVHGSACADGRTGI